MCSLKDNWDGCGAAAPGPEILRSAQQFLDLVSENAPLTAPFVSPTPSGGVLFYWQHGPHQLELEIGARDAVTYVYLHRESNPAVNLAGGRGPDAQISEPCASGSAVYYLRQMINELMESGKYRVRWEWAVGKAIEALKRMEAPL